MALLGGLPALVALGGPARADDPALTVTLESLETNGSTCLGAFRVDNTLGRDIGFMTLEVAVQRRDGKPGRLFALALMPVRDGAHPARATLPVLDSPCSVISDLLINRVTACRDRSTNPMDCDTPLRAASEIAIPLTK
jgi:hypothetical protein